MSVHLHIDRLVLDGVALDRAEARRLQLALERMLAARFADPALQAGLRRSPSIESRAVNAAETVAAAPPEASAARIADHVAAIALGARSRPVPPRSR
ncbi:hypothetical protein FHW12_004201 [Dokdonella fugitiva]|uniref:Uncharacterized protein n=1 Tax=Dokdonella fugitiva TaxID=328517 RepID=A0A839FD12_9GAMM|nr:hypothetical protein [Dokdonella fugitiva]MBA8889954.1 hypothetical protein [Dokdonella fugitiva]